MLRVGPLLALNLGVDGGGFFFDIRRQRSQIALRLVLVEFAPDVRLEDLGDFSGSGFGEIDSACAVAQFGVLAFGVGPEVGVLPIRIGKGVPDIDVGSAGLCDMVAIDLVQRQGLGVKRLVAHRRQSHPKDGYICVVERRKQRVDPLGVGGAPLVAQRVEHLAVVLERLHVVDAEHDHGDVDFGLRRQEVARRLRPVEIIVAREARDIAGKIGDGDLRLDGEGVCQALSGEDRQAVAEHRDEERRLDRRAARRAGRARRRRGHEVRFEVLSLVGRLVRALPERRVVRRRRRRLRAEPEQMLKEAGQAAGVLRL